MDGVRAACRHPDSRIVWGRWLGSDEDGYRCVAVELCAACSTVLNDATLWESEVRPSPTAAAGGVP